MSGPEEVDFGVSMSDSVLEHKLRDGKKADDAWCYWTFSHHAPKGAGRGSRMWVANHGRWVGYFRIQRTGESTEELEFFSDSFVRIDGGPRSPFMGYTFKVPL